MDSIILTFMGKHWLDVLLSVGIFLLVTARLIPPQLGGLSKEYWDANQQKLIKQENISFIAAVMNSVFSSVLNPVIAWLPIKGAISVIMFVVVGVELYNTKTISTNAMIITVAAILALYAETIVERAKKLSVLKLFNFESKDS